MTYIEFVKREFRSAREPPVFLATEGENRFYNHPIYGRVTVSPDNTPHQNPSGEEESRYHVYFQGHGFDISFKNRNQTLDNVIIKLFTSGTIGRLIERQFKAEENDARKAG